VDLTKLGLADAPFDTIVDDVEPYIHQDLIQNLPSIASYTIVQDPGCVSLSVMNSAGQLTGIDSNGNLDLNIPNSFYFASATNPGVLIADPSNGNYSGDVTGTCSGDYSLSIATDDLLDQTLSQVISSGDITDGENIPFNFSVNTSEPASVPEPGSLALLGAAFFGLIVFAARRRHVFHNPGE
jgi:hypothetical protein